MLSLAASFNEPDSVSLYNVVLFVHISAAIVAFGVTFVYPLIGAALSRPGNERHLAWWHRMEAEIGQKVITPAAVVILLAGIYLAADGPFDFGSTFVSIGIVIVVVLLGLAGAFFAPTERRAAELAQRDVDAAGGGEITMSAEYQAVAKRIALVGAIANVLILIAVFLMVTKPA
jgi:uncharacterized membrane protein